MCGHRHLTEQVDACLYMYDIASDEGCCTQSIEFSNDRKGFNQLWSRKETMKDFLVPISWSRQ
jgi:hypothetical protein